MSTQNHSSSPDSVHERLGASVPPTRLAEIASAVEGDREDHEHETAREHGWEWPEILRICFVAVAAASVWWRVWEPFPAVSVIGALGLLVGGWAIFKEALENLFARRMTMELSMSIAIIAAAAISEFFTALVITLFVLIAEVLEGLTVSRGRRAIRDLLEFLPRAVSVRRAGAVTEVEAHALTVGDAVLVNPGGRIPIDGTVIAGHSFVDQARITGESLPLEKMAGATVFAGSVNQSGALEIRAERIGRDTSYGKIIEAVEEAERSRAPVQRLADRLAGYLVYFALGAAALTYLLTHNVRSTISVVIVAGACGIAAGTPLAILGAIGRAAHAGAIIKGGLFLEQLGRVDTVVLDKTGTLTYGQPEVRELVLAAGTDAGQLLQIAASAELRSEHPLGKTTVAHARALGQVLKEPERFRYAPGLGIEAVIEGEHVLVGNEALMRAHDIPVSGLPRALHEEASRVFVARAMKLLGAIMVADTVRSEAADAIKTIEAMGIRTILLTGDARAVADVIGSELGIREVAADLLPEDKQARVGNLVAQGRTVAMVGDGINDAPALIEAQVGVAMGSGTDVARESADVVLLGNDLAAFAETLHIARRTRRIIWANFAGTIGVDTVGIALAAFGLLNPLFAAFIHVVSEFAFILNSARLLPPRLERAGNMRSASAGAARAVP
jgi:heavy metal translocating P-type ATPase